MKPGRELDALVAEKVMGWRKEATLPEYFFWKDVENGELKYHIDDWKPSTNIKYAWEVVEKLHDSGFYFTIKSPPRGKSDSYWVCIDDFYGKKYYTAHGVTAPLTICLAALEAVGVKVE
jgi:hypothetical protein